MAELTPDESAAQTLCPYCRVRCIDGAVKCWSCHADLPRARELPRIPVPRTGEESVVGHLQSSSLHAASPLAPRSAEGRGSVRRYLVALLLATMFLGGAVAWAHRDGSAFAANGQASDPALRAEVMAGGSALVEQIFSYDYRGYQAGREATAALMERRLANGFRLVMAALAPRVQADQVVARAQVTHAGLVSVESDRAELLFMINVERVDRFGESTSMIRVRMAVMRQAGDWVVSEVRRF